jgi:molybdenum cofactor cytidylyltransferase
MRVCAILLAAGSSRRFRGDKLTAPYHGRPLYRHALDALVSCPAVATTVVVVHPLFAAPVGLPRCRFVVNPDHAEGMGSSLRAGARAAPEDAEAFLVALADMPAITSALVTALVGFAARSPHRIVIPEHRGRRGHPVLIRSELRGELLAIRGDVGARGVIGSHPDLVGCFETDDPAVGFDVDVPADMGNAP